jgi:hypothetical protein
MVPSSRQLPPFPELYELFRQPGVICRSMSLSPPI